MKKTITILIAFILSISIYAQSAPEKFTYQAVVRNADNTLAISQDVGIRISILKTTSSGAVAYEETHTPTTNANGLLTIKIGEGDNKTGSISSIDWGADTYYIKTEIDLANGTNYSLTGDATQLLSVPYALHAKTADNVITHTAGDGIDITGNAIAVKPVSTGSGLTATVDGLKVKTDETTGSGLTATTDGLKVKTDETIGSGLTATTDGLKVKTDETIGSGLTATANGLKVKTDETIGSGLTATANGLKVKTDETIGSGLTATTDGLKVKTDETIGSGLTATTDGLKVKTGSGITIDGTGAITTEPTYAVGDQVLGGYVFYITDGGKHGLVVAEGDVTPTRKDLYMIKKGISIPENYNTEGKKYTDWRLPTLPELQMIYDVSRGQNGETQVNIGSFNNTAYWSDSATSTTQGNRLNFANGLIESVDYSNTNYGRAIRSF